MKTKSIAKNFFYDLFYRILTLIIPLITAPYISRVIGAEGIGNYSYTQSICSYFTLFAVLGSNVYGQREIAFRREDDTARTKAFWEIMVIRTIFILLSALCYSTVIIQSTGVIRVLFLIQMVDIVGLLFDITWLIQGVEDFGLIFYRNLIIKGLSVASIFLFVKTEQDLYLYVLLTSLAVIIGNISLWLQLRKYIVKIKVKELHPRKHLGPILALFLPTIALRLYDVLGKTLLGYIGKDAEENGYYEQALKIVTMAITIVTSLGNVMSPRMAYLHVQKDTEQLKKYFDISFDVVMILALPISVGLLTVADNLVPWFFGMDFLKVATLLKYISVICVAMGLKNLIGLQYLVSTNRQNSYTLSIVIGLIINVIISIILIPKYSSVGTVVASVISEYIIVAVQLYMIRKEISVWPLIKGSFSKIVACIGMGIVLWFVAGKLVSGIVNTCILVIIGAAVYGIILVVLRDKTVKYVFEKILCKIRSHKNR